MVDHNRAVLSRGLWGLALVGILVAPAFGWDEPEKFRGMPWGATLEQAQALLKEAGENCRESAGSCSVDAAKVGPIDGVSIFFGFGKTNRFERAMLLFPSSEYDAMRAIFVERYGGPTATTEFTLQNERGAKFTNEMLEWSGERVYITLQRYGPSLGDGFAIITLKAVLEQELEEQAKALKKGKHDL